MSWADDTDSGETWPSVQAMYAARLAEMRAILSASTLDPGSRDQARREVRG